MTDKKPEEIFEEYLDIVEFSIIKCRDGFRLIDRCEKNSGGIQEGVFATAYSIVERLSSYTEDYILSSVEEALNEKGIDTSNLNIKEIISYASEVLDDDYSGSVDILDLLYNHCDDIDLEKCFHETEEN